jgi:hypothetical protein
VDLGVVGAELIVADAGVDLLEGHGVRPDAAAHREADEVALLDGAARSERRSMTT